MSGVVDGPDICLSLACFLGYTWCVAHFLNRHLQGKSSMEVVLGGFLFCSYGVMTLFLVRSSIPYILYAACHHLLLIGITMAVFRENWAQKLLVAVVLVVLTGLMWNFMESFWSCTGLALFYRESRTGQRAMRDAWMDRMISVLTCGGGIIAVNLLSKPLSPVFTGKRKNWYLCLAFPLACIVLIMDVANWAASNGILVQAWGKYGLYENQLFSHGAMCIFTGLAMAAAGFLVFGMERVEREAKVGEQYRSQVLYYQMLEEQYAQMEGLRHDLKNHMLVLEKLVQNRQWEQAGAYLGEMAGAVGVEIRDLKAGSVKNTGIKTGDEVTGSLVMDALLYHKRRQAMENGIRWKCDVRMPKDCPVKEIDLCIIVGNILDNAIEACCRFPKDCSLDLRFIQVYLGTVKKCLFLEVKNSTDLTDKEEIGKSRKENSKEHGIGLANVSFTVAGYNGAMQTEVDNGVFTISVLMPLYRDDMV